MTTRTNVVWLIRLALQKALRIPAWMMRRIMAQYKQALHHLVLLLTEKYWLIDYLPQKSEGNNAVLLVRLDLIGDFIIWLDAAKEFKNLYPNKHIVLYANSSWAPLAKHLSHWDEVISVDVDRLRADDFYRLGILIKTHLQGFGVAIHPIFSREYVGDLVIRATKAKHCVAHFGDCNNIAADTKLISDNWYSHLVPRSVESVVEFSVNATLIRALGNHDFRSGLPKLPQLEFLPPHLKIEMPYCLVVPGASWAPKIWSAENFAVIAQQIQARHGLKIVVSGTASEQVICQSVATACGGNVLEVSGKTSLTQFVELIRNAALVVSNDSSAVHIASATGTRVVCILGGGHFGRFLPYQLEQTTDSRRLPLVINKEMDCYGCNWRCKYLIESGQIVPCISNVAIDHVISACERILVS